MTLCTEPCQFLRTSMRRRSDTVWTQRDGSTRRQRERLGDGRGWGGVGRGAHVRMHDPTTAHQSLVAVWQASRPLKG